MAKPQKLVAVAQDGGWGWMVLIGSFISYFLADGWCNSFGVLFPSLLENFDETKGKTSVIAALLYGMPMLMSPIVCALTTCYGCRIIGIIGGVLTAASLILSAYATSVTFMCVSIGVLGSVGLAMTYIPSLVIVTFYFEKRRGLATGLAVTGSGLGSILFPPFMEYLCGIYSWRGFLMITGGLCLHIVMAGFLYRPPPMGVPSDYEVGAEKDEIKAQVTSRDEKPPKFRDTVLVPRMHKQLKHTGSKSCSDINTGDFNSRYTYLGASELSLHFPGRCSGAVAIEMEDLYEHPKGVSNPEIYDLDWGIEHKQVAKSAKVVTPEKGSHIKVFCYELRVITTTMFDRSLVTNWAFLVFCGTNFVLYLWIGVPYVFLIDRAMELDISGDSYLFFLASIIGIGRTFGQIILGYLGDHPKIDCNVLYGLSIVIIGVDTILVPLCLSYWSLCVYSVVYGLFCSVTYAIQMMCIVDMVGLDRATSAFGLLQLLQGVATISGTPLAGWLYDVTGGYDPTFYTSGAWMTLSGFMMLPIPWLITRQSKGSPGVMH